MPAPQRPAPVIIVAVLNFLFGGMGLFGSFCGAFAVLVMPALLQSLPAPPAGQPGPKDLAAVFDSIPGYYPFMIGSLLLSLVMSVVLIAAGVGLLQMRSWGRTATLVFAVYTVLSTAAGLVYSITYVNPAMEKWVAQIQAKAGPGAPPPNPAGNIGGVVGGIVGALFNFGFAILVFVLLNLPDVRRAFARASLPPGPDEDVGEGWDDRRPPGDAGFRPADDRFR